MQAACLSASGMQAMALKDALRWSIAQTAVRMACSFISIKVTAVYLGPAGLALVGQLGNFMSLIQGVISNAIQTGVVKITAQSSGDRERLLALWGTAMKMTVGLGLAAALPIACLAWPIAGWLFKDVHYWPIVVLAALALPLVAAGTIVIGVVNGIQRVGMLGAIGIAAAVSGAVMVIPLSYFFGIGGGLVGTALAYCASLFFGLLVIYRRRGKADMPVKIGDFWGRWDRPLARSLIAFYPMLLVHVIAEPLAPLLMRGALTAGAGLAAAGFWQATVRLSDTYTLLLTAALSMYLMPRLSRIGDESGFGRELSNTVLTVAALTALAGLLLWLLRDVVIAIIFTPQFHPVRDLLPFQIVGDVCKLACWPLQMALVVKLRSYAYMAIDIVLTCLQVSLTYLCLPAMGVQAAPIAYASAYMLALLALIYLFRGYWHDALRRQTV